MTSPTQAAAAVDPLTGRIGNWMQTRSGKAWYHADPRPEDVDIVDIAHALSNLCRFGGHTRYFYSVAEHSVLVSRVVPPEFALWGLMHDATEAYVVDVPRPLKHMLSDYAEFEARAASAIALRFDLPTWESSIIKRADNAVLLAERDALLLKPPIPWAWADGITPADVTIRCLAPSSAKREFLLRFIELRGDL